MTDQGNAASVRDVAFPFPIKTVGRWRLALLRRRYPGCWWVQRGSRVYILRDPQEDDRG